MRSIVIVGAGIGGCTTYLFLKKYLSSDISVHIYESYPAPPYLSNLNRSKPTASLDLFVSEGDSSRGDKNHGRVYTECDYCDWRLARPQSKWPPRY
jgi:glycine/D-amino acid oxidase-like deaminating enzyme